MRSSKLNLSAKTELFQRTWANGERKICEINLSQNIFVKEFLLSTEPSFYTTLTSLINKLVNASQNNAPHATVINNWININTHKRWINFSIWLTSLCHLILQKYYYIGLTFENWRYYCIKRYFQRMSWLAIESGGKKLSNYWNIFLLPYLNIVCEIMSRVTRA